MFNETVWGKDETFLFLGKLYIVIYTENNYLL